MKKMIAIAMAAVMTVSVATVMPAYAKQTSKIVCGADGSGDILGSALTWSVSNGVMRIGGTGAMPNYTSSYNTPWRYSNTTSDPITSIVIGSGVTEIGDYAFSYLNNVTKVTFEQDSKLTRIGERSFASESALVSINNLPSTLKEIGKYAFSYCSRLESFTAPGPLTLGESAFDDCDLLKTVSLPNAKEIQSYAFAYCNNLAKVSAPKAMFDSYTFGNSSKNVIEVNAGGLKDRAIYSLSSIKKLTLSGAKPIGEYSVYDCVNLKSVSGKATTSIGKDAFYGCKELKSVSFPKVKSIGDYAFYQLEELTTVKLGKVQSIGEYAFNECKKLKKVSGAKNIKTIGKGAFRKDAKLTKFSAGSKLKKVDDYAFLGCSKLTGSFNFKNVTFIGSEAFALCENLANTLNFTKVSEIENQAFACCSKVKCNTLGTKLKTLRYRAFAGCKKIKSVYIPSTCKTIESAPFAEVYSINKSTGYYNYRVNPGFVIYGDKGSYANTFVKNNNNNYSASKCKFKVAVKKVTLSKKSVTVKKGKTYRLGISISPKNAAYRAVTLKTSNKKVATIDKNGNIKGVKKGKCVITATSKDGSLKSAKITVKVK